MRRRLLWATLAMFVVLGTVAGDSVPSPDRGETAVSGPTDVAWQSALATLGMSDVLGRGPTSSAPEWLAAAPLPAPRTVALVGDSGMVDLAPAFEATFAAAGVTKVVNAAWPGFGLTRPDFAWRDEWRSLIERENPAVVVVMLGGWDERYFETKGYRAYSSVVVEALEVLMARGARIEWLAMLPGGRSYLPPVNTVYAQGPLLSRSIDFFDPQAVLRAPDGSLTRTVPSLQGPLLVRKPDDWHFCPAGAALVAATTHARLSSLGWVPPAAVGWQQGPWRNRKDIYDEPPGACDPPPGVTLG